MTNNDLFSEKSDVASWYDIKLASKTPQGALTGETKQLFGEQHLSSAA